MRWRDDEGRVYGTDHLGRPVLESDAQRLVVVDVCTTCGGEGAVSGFPDTPWEQCEGCNGTGFSLGEDRPGDSTCPDCDGRGVRWTT